MPTVSEESIYCSLRVFEVNEKTQGYTSILSWHTKVSMPPLSIPSNVTKKKKVYSSLPGEF